MAKILNLDKFGTNEKRELQLKGVSYQVQGMTVKRFIETTRVAEQMEGKSLADQMVASISLIRSAIPDLAEDALDGLEIEQLAAIARFVRGEDVMEPTEDTQEGEAEKN